MKCSRRSFIKQLSMLSTGTLLSGVSRIPPFDMGPKTVPVLDITDLYHPPQDFGDTFDLIFPYAIPEIELLGVLFDVTHKYRIPYHGEGNGLYADPQGGREPGVITVWQLNYLFDRDVPCAPCPFVAMTGENDSSSHRGTFETQGLKLFEQILIQSKNLIEIVSFGSARPLALALNRFPSLLKEKVKRIHLCAGSYPPGELLEWNVKLDPQAFIRVINSDLPIYIYPCANKGNPFALGQFCTFWLMPNLEFLKEIDKRLLRFLVYAHSRSNRVDFLQVLEEEPPEEAKQALFQRSHPVWETDVWLEVSKRLLVQRSDGSYRIIPVTERKPGDKVISPNFLPIKMIPQNDGNFEIDWESKTKPHRIFYRQNPEEHQQAMQEALPLLYKSFKIVHRIF